MSSAICWKHTSLSPVPSVPSSTMRTVLDTSFKRSLALANLSLTSLTAQKDHLTRRLETCWRGLSLPLFCPAQTEKIWQALWGFGKQRRATMQYVSQQFSWGSAGEVQTNFCKVKKRKTKKISLFNIFNVNVISSYNYKSLAVWMNLSTEMYVVYLILLLRKYFEFSDWTGSKSTIKVEQSGKKMRTSKKPHQLSLIIWL